MNPFAHLRGAFMNALDKKRRSCYPWSGSVQSQGSRVAACAVPTLLSFVTSLRVELQIVADEAQSESRLKIPALGCRDLGTA